MQNNNNDNDKIIEEASTHSRLSTNSEERQRWEVDEQVRLVELVIERILRLLDWTDISNHLETTRTPQECFLFLFALSPRKEWNEKEEENLSELVKQQFAEADNGGRYVDWEEVSEALGTSQTPLACLQKYATTKAKNIHGERKGRWSKEEDLLQLAIETYGPNFDHIQKVIAGRSGEQCRDAWRRRISKETSRTEKNSFSKTTKAQTKATDTTARANTTTTKTLRLPNERPPSPPTPTAVG